MDEIIVVNGQTPLFFTKKVRIVNQGCSRNDCGARHVTVVEDGEACFGPVRVLATYALGDEPVYVENPEGLPFDLKVELYGPPPCPQCERRIKLNSDLGTYTCVSCGTTWTRAKLAEIRKGMLWPPPFAS